MPFKPHVVYDDDAVDSHVTGSEVIGVGKARTRRKYKISTDIAIYVM